MEDIFKVSVKTSGDKNVSEGLSLTLNRAIKQANDLAFEHNILLSSDEIDSLKNTGQLTYLKHIFIIEKVKLNTFPVEVQNFLVKNNSIR